MVFSTSPGSELTLQGTSPYPILVNGNLSSKVPLGRDMLVPRRVYIYKMMLCAFSQTIFFHHRNQGGSKKSNGNFDGVGF